MVAFRDQVATVLLQNKPCGKGFGLEHAQKSHDFKKGEPTNWIDLT